MLIAQVFKDGWYYTGDIGAVSVVEDGSRRLSIIDRKTALTELYVDHDSVWVQSSRLEGEVYSKCPLVSQVFLHGSRMQSQLLAVVVPQRWVLESYPLPEQQQRVILDALRATAAAQGITKDWEIPAAVIVEPQPWTLNNGLLSAVGKLCRGALALKYEVRGGGGGSDESVGRRIDPMPSFAACMRRLGLRMHTRVWSVGRRRWLLLAQRQFVWPQA